MDGGGRRLCKEDVGWIVDLNNFLASWSLRWRESGREEGYGEGRGYMRRRRNEGKGKKKGKGGERLCFSSQ